MAGRPDALTLGAFAAMVALAGGNAVAISFSNRELPPFWGASLRFLLAAALFLAVALAWRIPLPRGRALAGAALYGVLGFAGAYAFAYWGIQHVQPGLAQTLLALVPLLTLLLALAHGLERFRWASVAGALLALAGVAVVFREQVDARAAPLGLLAVLASAACFAEAGVVAKRLPRAHPVVTNLVGMGVGALLLLALSLAAGEKPALPRQRETWTAVLFLAVVGSVLVFALFLFVLGRWTASATSYQFVLLPFVALAVSAWLTGERVTAGYALGGGLVLAGVYVGALRVARPAPAEGPEDAAA